MIRRETFGYSVTIDATEDGDRAGVERLALVALGRGLTVNVLRTSGPVRHLVVRLMPRRGSVMVGRPGGVFFEPNAAVAVRRGMSSFAGDDAPA